MTTGREKSPTEQWKELYKAAVFETDKSKLSGRIEEAQAALVLRMRELFHSRENIQERQAVDVAISALRMLRSATAHADKRHGFQRPRSDAAHAA